MAEIIDIKENRPTEGESAGMEQQNNGGISEENGDFVSPEGDTPKVEQGGGPNESANGEGETAPPPCDWKNASGDDDSRPDKDDEDETSMSAGSPLDLRERTFDKIIDAANMALNNLIRELHEKRQHDGELNIKVTFADCGCEGIEFDGQVGGKINFSLKSTKVSLDENVQIIFDALGNPIIPQNRQHQVTFDELKNEPPPATITVDGTTGIVEHVDNGIDSDDETDPEDVVFPCEIDGCPFYAYDTDVNGCGYGPVNNDDCEDINSAVEECGCTRPEVLQAYADGQVNKESEGEIMEANVIKLKFIRGGKPSGREYTYYTNTAVAVGDTVEVDGKNGISQGVVTQIDIPKSEIEPFKDNAKTIIGKVKTDESEDK